MSNEQKPTQGPWIKMKVGDVYWIEDNDPNAAFRRRIAIVNDGAGIESPEANADLLAAAWETLAAREACCIATQGKEKAFCECVQRDGKQYLDMEGVCWLGESGNCRIWNAIRKAKGTQQ